MKLCQGRSVIMFANIAYKPQLCNAATGACACACSKEGVDGLCEHKFDDAFDIYQVHGAGNFNTKISDFRLKL